MLLITERVVAVVVVVVVVCGFRSACCVMFLLDGGRKELASKLVTLTLSLELDEVWLAASGEDGSTVLEDVSMESFAVRLSEDVRVGVLVSFENERKPEFIIMSPNDETFAFPLDSSESNRMGGKRVLVSSFEKVTSSDEDIDVVVVVAIVVTADVGGGSVVVVGGSGSGVVVETVREYRGDIILLLFCLLVAQGPRYSTSTASSLKYCCTIILKTLEKVLPVPGPLITFSSC